MNIGTRLYSLRVDRKLTVIEISERFSVSKNTVYRWERGYFAPKRTVLIDIAEFYGVTVDWILKGRVSEKNDIERRLSSSQYPSAGQANGESISPIIKGRDEELGNFIRQSMTGSNGFDIGFADAVNRLEDAASETEIRLSQQHLITLFSMLSYSRQERLVNYLNSLCSEELLEKSASPR